MRPWIITLLTSLLWLNNASADNLPSTMDFACADIEYQATGHQTEFRKICLNDTIAVVSTEGLYAVSLIYNVAVLQKTSSSWELSLLLRNGSYKKPILISLASADSNKELKAALLENPGSAASILGGPFPEHQDFNFKASGFILETVYLKYL